MTNDSDAHRDDSTSEPGDLSHLHPDRLRIGGVGVFAGDWAWTGDPDPRIPVGFVGTLIDYWNGWAVFLCTREVADAIVADHNRARQEERAFLATRATAGQDVDRQVDEVVPPMWFDGDDLICDETAMHREPSVNRQRPDDDGRYCVQGYCWTWTAVDPAACDRIVGQIPPPGEQQEFVIATHQPLRMPHERLTVTDIQYLQMSSGVAFTATLQLDGQDVGTIENTGRGGNTMFRPSGTGFGRPQMGAFVAACRWGGEPVDEDQVLEALLTEYEIGLQVRAADAEGNALILLRDDDGHIVAVGYTMDKGQIRNRRLRDLADQLTAAEAVNFPYLTRFVWEVWSGSRWRFLGAVDVRRSDDTGDPS